MRSGRVLPRWQVLTGHDSFPTEPRATQLEHHAHHVAPYCLFFFVVSFPKPGVLTVAFQPITRKIRKSTTRSLLVILKLHIVLIFRKL